jgi:hypothetical protein
MHGVGRCRAVRRKTVQLFDTSVDATSRRHARSMSLIGEFAAHRNISDDSWNKESEAMLLSPRLGFSAVTSTARLKNAALKAVFE